MSQPNDKWPDLLADLFEHTRDVLVRRGIADQVALAAARELTDRIRHNWGGQLLYIPSGRLIDTDERARKIFADVRSGVAPKDVAAKHRVSIQWVYRIVDAMQHLEFTSRQDPLDLR